MGSRCPTCQGTGFELRTTERGVTTAVPCACRVAEHGERLLHATRIPRRYEHCTLDNYEPQEATQAEALRVAREWTELWPATRHGLLFVGPPGTGKTHLTVAMARELVAQKSARVQFHEQRELLKSLQATFDAGSHEREAEILAPVLSAEVLILDDVGAGRTTPWAREVMHDVIAQRYNHDKPLIMTTHHPLDQAAGKGRDRGGALDGPLTLHDRLGDALMSRLYEMCRVVTLGGKDFRAGVLNARHHC